MDTVLVTGSAGLVGSEAVGFFAKKGWRVIGIDNDMREYFFGKNASIKGNQQRLKREFPAYVHQNIDIRNLSKLEKIFRRDQKDIKLIIHAAAQPSHDWAAKEPFVDFSINANGTLNLLEMSRKHCPSVVFIYMSTNKVYGDLPNALPLIEGEKRWDLPAGHKYYEGIDEGMSIDQSQHSLFGASKLSADVLVQEYGRYFGMRTVCFRGGCLTGPYHAGTELHGFLSYLMKCCITGDTYTIFGYKGKQVRDNIHSFDLANAFEHFYKNPRVGEVYNIGGGRRNSCSIQEAIEISEKITGRKLKSVYSAQNRSGDHIWYISNIQKFKSHYPLWQQKYGLEETLQQIYQHFTVKK
ncbi:MAG: NAD-dependent epimerase/dehydratase family protein [Candidatus Omnitrophota bacterium]